MFRTLWADFFSEWSKKLTKILPRIFKQCCRPFNMLTVHKFSDTQVFRHLSCPCFSSLKFQKEIIYEGHLFFSNDSKFFFFSNDSKFFVGSWNSAKNSENIFWFWDNIIWIVCVRHSVILRDNTFHRVSIC